MATRRWSMRKPRGQMTLRQDTYRTPTFERREDHGRTRQRGYGERQYSTSVITWRSDDRISHIAFASALCFSVVCVCPSWKLLSSRRLLPFIPSAARYRCWWCCCWWWWWWLRQCRARKHHCRPCLVVWNMANKLTVPEAMMIIDPRVPRVLLLLPTKDWRTRAKWKWWGRNHALPRR